MPPAPFPAARALATLRALERAARSPHDPADPLAARRALAATGALPLAATELGAAGLLGARVPGREPGPPWLLCAPLTTPADVPDWRPNAHGSGWALLLTLMEALHAEPPAQDVLGLAFPGEATAAASDAAAAWAARELLPLRGVLGLWQIAAPGLALELDVRSLTQPAARALTLEVFTLGRALGHAPFARGSQTAFPGLHAPFLARGLPALALCGATDLAAGSADDTLAACAEDSLFAVGDTLLRFLRGERAV